MEFGLFVYVIMGYLLCPCVQHVPFRTLNWWKSIITSGLLYVGFVFLLFGFLGSLSLFEPCFCLSNLDELLRVLPTITAGGLIRAPTNSLAGTRDGLSYAETLLHKHAGATRAAAPAGAGRAVQDSQGSGSAHSCYNLYILYFFHPQTGVYQCIMTVVSSKVSYFQEKITKFAS